LEASLKDEDGEPHELDALFNRDTSTTPHPKPVGSKQTVLYHPYSIGETRVLGNLHWEPPFDPGLKDQLSTGIRCLEEKGYWVSQFPEGDGLTWSHESYDADCGIADFRQCFPWMEITEAPRGDHR
jgi:hypothetical protein